jgi:ankyrin repeat protein
MLVLFWQLYQWLQAIKRMVCCRSLFEVFLQGSFAAKDPATGTGRTALYFASKSGHVGIVQALLSAGTAKNNEDDVNPLLIVSWLGHICIV